MTENVCLWFWLLKWIVVANSVYDKCWHRALGLGKHETVGWDREKGKGKERKKGEPKICQCACPFRMGPTFVSCSRFYIAVPSLNNWFALWKNVTCTPMRINWAHAFLHFCKSALRVYNTWIHVGTSTIYHSYLPNSNSNASNFVGLIFGIAFDQTVSAYRIDLIQNTPPCLYICHQCLYPKIEILVNSKHHRIAMPMPFREKRRKTASFIINEFVDANEIETNQRTKKDKYRCDEWGKSFCNFEREQKL